MDNFIVIYKILKELEKAMDREEFDIERISSERLKVSENRLYNILEILNKAGYIEGISCKYGIRCGWDINISSPKITLKGLEYLVESNLIIIAANLEKGIRETKPYI